MSVKNHEICVAFAHVDAQVKRCHVKASFVRWGLNARQHQPCTYTASMRQVNPRFLPGGKEETS